MYWCFYTTLFIFLPFLGKVMTFLGQLLFYSFISMNEKKQKDLINKSPGFMWNFPPFMFLRCKKYLFVKLVLTKLLKQKNIASSIYAGHGRGLWSTLLVHCLTRNTAWKWAIVDNSKSWHDTHNLDQFVYARYA